MSDFVCCRTVIAVSSLKIHFFNIQSVLKKSSNMASAVSKASVMLNRLMVQAKPQLEVFMKYAKVELVPPTPGDIPAIRQGIGRLISGARTGAYKNLTVREAWLNTLVTMEVCFWFYIGECIGKRHLVGYKV